MPWRIMGACRVEAFLIRIHITLPEFSLLNIRKANFPVLFRLVLREVEEEPNDAGSVVMKMFFQIHDRTISAVPDLLVVMRRVLDCFAAENLGMRTDNQHLFVV